MITIDFETRSEADLKKVGVVAYAQHPSTQIICMCYGIDSAPIQEWWPGKNDCRPGQRVSQNDGQFDWLPDSEHEALSHDLYTAMHTGHVFEAHNIAFEWSIWKYICEARWGWPMPYDHIWRDTMAVACYYAMPAALDKLAKALGFEGKDPEGDRLITKYSKLHLKTAKRDIPIEDFKKFVAYCRKDVAIEQSVSDYLGDLPEREVPIFLLDQEINRRGLCLDVKGIASATKVVEQRYAERAAEFQAKTGLTPTQTKKLKEEWFPAQGFPVENLQKGYLTDMLEENALIVEIEHADGVVEERRKTLTPLVREAIELRLETAKASTKKLDAMARQVGSDGRARFQSRYHGTITGRQTGTGFQPLNLKKSEFEDLRGDRHGDAAARLVRDIGYEDAAWLDCIYGDAINAVASAARHWIKAAPGHRIVAGDFVSIEAVLNACAAGEEWKVEAFRRGDPIYELMGCKIHNLGPEAEQLAHDNKSAFKKEYTLERQDGKVGELAFGYQGALGAWRKFDPSDRHTDDAVIKICKSWRAEHPMIVKSWYAIEDAAIECVLHKKPTGYGIFEFEMVDDWLSMIAPDGKRIWYREPELRQRMPRWHDVEANEDCAAGTCKCEPKLAVTYMSMKNGQWKRVYTYGGKLVENAIQFLSRQILKPAMLRLADAGYPIILDVYDEIVAEVPKGFCGMTDDQIKAEMEEIMCESPGPWADAFPIGADCWIGDRYQK